ncbi:hypothetical protein M758_UG056900 [Ceratodon purpureus]|nr:hypothetical protein M758_UG056900 [Ceratodon purpureus]
MPLNSASISPPVVYCNSGHVCSANERRNFMRRERREYLLNQRNHAGEGGKTLIPKDVQGNVIALRTVLHCAIRDIARRVLDVSVKEFNTLPPMAFELIEHDMHSRFAFHPPLKPGYIKAYLSESLTWCRYQWRSHWGKTQSRHPQCPQKQYPAYVSQ